MRALISGATGHIGRSLAQLLFNNGHEITAIVRSSSDVSVLPTGTDIKVCDGGSSAELTSSLKGNGYDTFFDLAWPGSSGADREDEAMQMNSASLSTERSRAAVILGCGRYVFTGSVAQYYLRNGADAKGTKNFYGAAKEHAEHATRDVCRDGGTEHVAVHLASTYSRDATAGIVHYMVKGMRNNDKISLAPKDTLTDLVHVSDAVNGIFLAGTKGKHTASYFVGSGEPMTIGEYAGIIRCAAGSSSELRFGDVRPYGRLAADDLSIEPLKKDTGYVPRIKFADGLRSIL